MSNKFLGVDNGKTGWMVAIIGNEIVDKQCYESNNAKSTIAFLEKHNDAKLIALEEPFMSFQFSKVSAVGFELMGRYKACFEILDAPYTMASPRVGGWRKLVGYTSKGRDNLKQESIALVLQQFINGEEHISFVSRKRVEGKLQPVKQYNDNIADSVMLAVYARLHYEGGKECVK
jgi:hypothetical protein